MPAGYPQLGLRTITSESCQLNKPVFVNTSTGARSLTPRAAETRNSNGPRRETAEKRRLTLGICFSDCGDPIAPIDRLAIPAGVTNLSIMAPASTEPTPAKGLPTISGSFLRAAVSWLFKEVLRLGKLTVC